MNRRAIITRAFWEDYWLEIRRFGRDKRARKSFFFRNLLILFFLAYLGYYVALFRSMHDPAMEAGMAVLLGVIAGIMTAVKWSQHRESKRRLAEDIASAPPDVTLRLQLLAHGLAAISERALGELWLMKHAVPDGHQVVTRRIQIDTLKARGVWEELPPYVRDWTMRPDGTWPPERIAQVLSMSEVLHTLLWALGLTRTLRPLNQLVSPLQFGKLAKDLQKPAPGVLPSWELRLARNDAQQYFGRCYAENIYRGSSDAATEEQRKAVNEWMSSIRDGDQADSLAGAETISEVEPSTLDIIGRSAACRAQTLAIIMDLLDEKARWEEMQSFVYSALASPKDRQSSP